MISKSLCTITIFAFSNIIWASGGLSIDSVDKHMNTSGWITTKSERTKITTQAPVDRFNVNLGVHQEYFVDTNKFKQNYDGQS